MTTLLFRFPWSGGEYGVTGPNKKIPHLHLFLTVKRGTEASDVLRDLKVKFECDAKEYFEFLQEPERKPKVKYLADTNDASSPSSSASPVIPSPGGGMLACVETTVRNPMRVPEKNETGDIPEMSGANKGTLTMFCFKDGKHYALTCFHVGSKNHSDEFLSPSADTNNQKDSSKISAMLKKYWYATTVESNEGIVFDDDGSNYKNLGVYHGHCLSYDCDIMSLEVSEKTEVSCKIVDVTSPDWIRIWRELIENVKSVKECGESAIRVEKDGGFSPVLTCGQIVCHSYCQRDLFRNAIIVKGCDDQFATEGDSGAPLFFIDEKDTRQVFAYVAHNVDALSLPEHEPGCSDDSDSDSSSISSEEDSSQEDTLEYEGEKDEYADQDKSGDESENGGKFEVDKDGKYQDEADDQSDVEIEFSKASETGPYVICFRLDTALEKLGLIEAACFSDCRKSDS